MKEREREKWEGGKFWRFGTRVWKTKHQRLAWWWQWHASLTWRKKGEKSRKSLLSGHPQWRHHLERQLLEDVPTGAGWWRGIMTPGLMELRGSQNTYPYWLTPCISAAARTNVNHPFMSIIKGGNVNMGLWPHRFAVPSVTCQRSTGHSSSIHPPWSLPINIGPAYKQDCGPPMGKSDIR